MTIVLTNGCQVARAGQYGLVVGQAELGVGEDRPPPVRRMSAAGRNDVTSRPAVGIVHTIAITIAMMDAAGELQPVLGVDRALLGAGSACAWTVGGRTALGRGGRHGGRCRRIRLGHRSPSEMRIWRTL